MHPDDVPRAKQPVELADILVLLNRMKWRILIAGLVVASLVIAWVLTRPSIYVAKATFREQGMQGSTATGLSGIVSFLTTSGTPGLEEVLPLFKSKRLWLPLVERYQLQVAINELPPPVNIGDRILNNLQAEWAYLIDREELLLPDVPAPVTTQAIAYTGEVPLKFHIRFVDEENFEMLNATGELPLTGSLGSALQAPAFSLVLARGDQQPLTGRQFSVKVNPVDLTTHKLAKLLDVWPGEKGDLVVNLAFYHPDRYLVSTLLNGLMEQYQQFLQAEHEALAEVQVDYLERRRQDSSNNLQSLILTYASDLSEQLPNSGILDSQVELEALNGQKAAFRQRLRSIDLELKRIQNKDGDREGYLDTLGASPSLPELVRSTISSINELKQRRDRLVLALRKNTSQDPDQFEIQFGRQIADLHEIQANIEQTRRLHDHIVHGHSLATPSSLSSDTPPVLQLWYQHLYASQGKPSWEELKNHFLSYLNSFLRLSIVQQKLIQERLALQHNPGPELQGVDLPTANNIYVKLTEEQSNTQAEMRQNAFVIEQVKDPSFEISSLSGTLQDPVSRGIIERYSSQSMSLKDSTIRSPKEQERIKEELAQQRTFLLFHLQQANQLLALREEFLKQKIRATQEVMLDLIQQQVSVSEKHLQDYTKAHIEQLKQERGFISDAVQEINQQMTILPHKWAAEQMIHHQAKVSQAIVEEITKLVETKNISGHLETVQSSPLDLAVSPILPKRPHVILFSLLGMILGSGIATTWFICKALRHGITVSAINLAQAGQNVAGKLPLDRRRYRFKPLENRSQLDTLRRIAASLCPARTNQPANKLLLLLVSDGVNYSSALATLLAKEGYKVLRLNLSFDRESDSAHQPGLLQYLEGNAPEPKIVSKGEFDSVDGGGISLYGNELLQSARFQELTQNLASRYDWILAVSRAKPTSAEALVLSHLFQHIAVTVGRETLPDVQAYMNLPSVTWVLTDWK